MKLKGTIGHQEVVVMIDSGAAHNFIFEDLITQLGIPKVHTGPFGVTLSTSLSVQGNGVCCSVVLSLPVVDVVEDFIPLKLGSSDIILGVKWLETLGEVKMNWKLSTMKFKVGGNVVTLHGDPGLNCSLVSLKSLVHELHN